MRIAVTGSQGQLGLALQRVLVDEPLLPIDLPQRDITNLPAILETVNAWRPDVIIHAAAMTDVDGCERNPEAAYRVNALGTRNMAVAAQQCGAALVYISTDYVFDGTQSEPYWEFDDANPLSVYARTKWVGEQLVRQLVSRHYVVRVAWLYGDGPRNFVKTVLRLAAERDSLSMVTDEIGSPTNAGDVAAALARLVRLPAYGTYHLPNSGVCSRYEWAREVLRLAGHGDYPLLPSENYPRLARVPKRAEMRNFCGAELGLTMRPWQEALADYIAELTQ
ncbi:MAG: dTDP-4-dehydrorhamnose reductase [Anaerolineae bacterium]